MMPHHAPARRVAGGSLSLFVGLSFALAMPALAQGPRSDVFDLHAAQVEWRLGRSGPESRVAVPVRVRRLAPGEPVTLELSIEPLGGETDRQGAVGQPVILASVFPPVVQLGGEPSAEADVVIGLWASSGATEGMSASYGLRVSGQGLPGGGARELRLRAVIDEQAPRLELGADELGRPERALVLACGGQADVILAATNDGVRAGTFRVVCNAPAGWRAGLPDLPVRLLDLPAGGESSESLTIHVVAAQGLPAGQRAAVSVSLTSLATGEACTLALEVENGGQMYVPSATGKPVPHLVRPARMTSWVAHLFPFEDGPRIVHLSFAHDSLPWRRELSRELVELSAEEGPQEVEAWIWAPADAQPGLEVAFTLRAVTDRGELMQATLAARVTDMPHTYIVALDGLNAEYLDLDRTGTRPGGEGDWLMPNARELVRRGVSYREAHADLPAATDMNHMNILCGTMTGTSGVSMVSAYYAGRDELGRPVIMPGSREQLSYGVDAARVITYFEGVRQREPGARGAFVSGKGWLNELLEDGGETIQVSVSGMTGPDYVGRPLPYVLGDPATDEDAAADPPARFRLGDQSVGELIGSLPAAFPEDAYVMDAALEVLRHEDPDVMYVLLGCVDDVQHFMGNASNLEDWDDRGTESTYDDQNAINPLATREETLDVVRDADAQIGRLVAMLKSRDRLEDSYVVLVADHGQVTHPFGALHFEERLRYSGISTDQDLFAYAGTSLMAVYDLPDELVGRAETILQDLALAIDREEMQSGYDSFSTRQLAMPMELYSTCWASRDESPKPIYRWPKLYVLIDGPEQFALSGGGLPNLGIIGSASVPVPPIGVFVGGHGGPNTSHVPLVLAGPGVAEGRVIDESVRIHGLVPTLYDLQGIPTPPGTDGEVLPGARW